MVLYLILYMGKFCLYINYLGFRDLVLEFETWILYLVRVYGRFLPKLEIVYDIVQI